MKYLVEAYRKFAENIHMITGHADDFTIAVPMAHYRRLIDELACNKPTNSHELYLMTQVVFRTPTNEITVQPLANTEIETETDTEEESAIPRWLGL
jgi:hypothetical protein